MTTLHIVSASPSASNALQRALSLAGNNDAVLLIENAVYAASDTEYYRQLLSTAAGVKFFVLTEDLSARAVSTVLECCTPVSYGGFVELVCQYSNSVSWS